MWRFPSNDAEMTFSNKLSAEHPDWLRISDRSIIRDLDFSLIGEGDILAMLFPLPLPMSNTYSVLNGENVRIIKLVCGTGKKKKQWLLAIAPRENINEIRSTLIALGARETKNMSGMPTLTDNSTVTIRVEGWAIEIQCDLYDIHHLYSLKPKQQYKWKGDYPDGVKTYIPWSGVIHSTRKRWAQDKNWLADEGIHWEGDDPDKLTVTQPVDANYGCVPRMD